MKKICSWVYLLLCCVGCTRTGYVIQGTVAGMQEGQVAIIVYRDEPDTLGIADIVDGKFEFRGVVQEVIPATLQIKGQNMGGIPLYLENEKYEVKLDVRDFYAGEIAGGGESQQLSNEFEAIERGVAETVKTFREEYIQAIRSGDTLVTQRLNRTMDSLRRDSESKRNAFLSAHPTSYVALNYYTNNAKMFPVDELAAIVRNFPSEMLETTTGKRLTGQLQMLEKLSDGKIAPDFKVRNLAGEEFTLHSVKAKVKIIDFWASWCGPCRALVPQLIELYKELHPKGLEIVGISMDTDEAAWKKAVEEEKMPWLQGSDLKGFEKEAPLAKLYAISGIPHLVVVDEQNRIVATNMRGKELHDLLLKLLNK